MTTRRTAASQFPQVLRDLRKELLHHLARQPYAAVAAEIGIGRNTLHAWLMDPETGSVRTVCKIAQWVQRQMP